MKKNNLYLTEDGIEAGDVIKILWKEKFLILPISIICMLFTYLQMRDQPKEFKTQIIIKDPPLQLFEKYDHIFQSTSIYKTSIIKNKDNTRITKNTYDTQVKFIDTQGRFFSNFNLNLNSLDNLENFVEQSKEIDNFKIFLNAKNVTARQYFQANRFGKVKENNEEVYNSYFLVYPEELDGIIFFINYIEFTKKNTIIEFTSNLNTSIQNIILLYEQALEIAIQIKLENPILLSNQKEGFLLVQEPDALFYKGSKILAQEIVNLKKAKFTNQTIELISYDPILDKPSIGFSKAKSLLSPTLAGLISGFFLSLTIIYFKNYIKTKRM